MRLLMAFFIADQIILIEPPVDPLKLWSHSDVGAKYKVSILNALAWPNQYRV